MSIQPFHGNCPHDEARASIALEHPGSEVIAGTVWMPFPAGRHPCADEVAPESVAWLLDVGMLQSAPGAIREFEASHFDELAALVYRREDREGLRLAVDFIAALFFFDDFVDEGQSRIGTDCALALRAAEFLGVAIRTGRPPRLAPGGWPLTAADLRKLAVLGEVFADITRRLVHRRGTPDLEYYAREMDRYFASTAREASLRRGQDFSGVADYATARTRFSAVYACLELGLLLRRLRPSATARADPRFTSAMTATNLSVSYINDIFSYKKELAHGERSNLVMVLAQSSSLSLRAAFVEACRVCDEVLARYLRDRVHVERLDPDAFAATELFESWIRGSFDWHAGRTRRYADVLSTHSPLRGPDRRQTAVVGCRGDSR